MVDVDLLDPLLAVMAGGVRVVVDAARPVAALIDVDGAVRVVTWADAALPARSASGHTLAAPGCVWVIYSEDFTVDDPARTTTAVRIGADATVGWCELGSLEVAGADEVGVWTTAHPYLAMAASREHMPGAELFQAAPAWLADAPALSQQDFQRALEQAGRADVEAAMAAAAADDQEPTGWFAFSPDAAGQPPLDPPPAPVPTGAAVLYRTRPGGQVEQMSVSRVVSQVIAPAPGMLRLIFHPTTPMITNTADGHGHTYDHPRRAVVIDATQALPERVDFGALDSQPVGDELPTYEPRQASDVVDLAGIAATRWTLRNPGPQQTQAAVDAVVEQYAALGDPQAVHTRRDGRWYRVESRYSQVTVHAEGTWPHTQVVADFIIDTQPDYHLRRYTHVFDHAGLPIAFPDLAARLEEDLEEADLDELPEREDRRLI